MMGPFIFVITKCDGTLEIHHFEDDTELYYVIRNGMKWGETGYMTFLSGQNVWLARRYVRSAAEHGMKKEGYGCR